MTIDDLQHPPASPLQRLHDEHWTKEGVELWIKRDDLLAPSLNDPLCGNKWRKLQHNLLQARAQGHQQLLTFGGAYSNHLAAVASAGRHFGFQTVGVVRGEQVSNPTLAQARANGMKLHFIDRTTYRQKQAPEFIASLLQQFGSSYVIPEGGTNTEAYPGCSALAQEILTQSPTLPTHIALACGTGGTATGVIQGLAGRAEVLGISVLKGGFMTKAIQELLADQPEATTSWTIQDDYHHGGYAKQSAALREFVQRFYQQHGILLEPIYTGKLFYALYDLVEKGYFPRGSRVVGIHTGGLQAYASYVPTE